MRHIDPFNLAVWTIVVFWWVPVVMILNWVGVL